MNIFRTFINEEKPEDKEDISSLLNPTGEAEQPTTDKESSTETQSDIPDETPSGDLDATGGNDKEINPDDISSMLDQEAAEQKNQDPNKQGLIRKVPNAHLVYKRMGSEGTYEELWIYNIGQLQDELKVRQAVLAGTDIPPGKTSSPDGSQTYRIWTAGNAEMLNIVGLPN